MMPIVVQLLRDLFAMIVIFFSNYVMFIGLRDILYLILPIGPPARPRIKAFGAKDLLRKKTLIRILLWILFIPISVFLIKFLMPFVGFIVLAYFLFANAEKRRIGEAWATMLCAVLLMALTFAFIKTQPVLMRIDTQFSVDLWIYNVSNSYIDLMIMAAQKFGIGTEGILRLAELVPWIQNNVFGLLFLSLYLFSGAMLGSISKLVLPGTGYRPAPYPSFGPVWIFGLFAVVCMIISAFVPIPGLMFVVGGIYYLWGANFLFFAIRGGHRLLNLFIIAAAALHPATVAVFIVVGVLDNLFDLRRFAAVAGLVPRKI